MHRNQKVLARIRALGYCCPWEFFRQLSHLSQQDIANLLGVRTRTVRFWKLRSTHCMESPDCHNNHY